LNDRAFTHERLNLGSDLLELDRNKFNECLASDRPDALIDSITQEITAPNSGFEGTPSLMINGRMVQGSPTWAVLKSKIFDMVRAVNP
jgi:protein-disulfide isomerase